MKYPGKCIFVITAVSLLVLHAWAASREKILYSFGSGNDAQYPLAALTFDDQGNLFGTSSGGGDFNGGAIFELLPSRSGWTEKVLYSFTSGSDGFAPQGGLIQDRKGNLYGTASGGGDFSCALTGCGTVFELSPMKNGHWKFILLHQFTGGDDDGNLPTGKLAIDRQGNLYGETIHGGHFDGGVVFELKHTSSGWQESAIYIFGVSGGAPIGGLVFDKAGNLYGAASLGNDGLGTLFELSPNGGKWRERDLHRFTGKDGRTPMAGLVIDSAGNLYGTTTLGSGPCCFGQYGCGNVFELSPGAHARWKETTLYTFKGGQDGQASQGVLLLGPDGTLYGTTTEGGGTGCNFGFGCGTVFELRFVARKWTERVLHRFQSAQDGKQPDAGLISDKYGNLYGITLSGGANNVGTVFEIVP